LPRFEALVYNGRSYPRSACFPDRQSSPGDEPFVAKVLVRLPLGVSLAGMPTLMDCEGATVAEVLAHCVAMEPRLGGRIFRQDGTLWVGVSINGTNLPPEMALVAAVKDGDGIRLLPAVGAC
jgi:hypothetical protein